MPHSSLANSAPVRPNPVATSSQMSGTPRDWTASANAATCSGSVTRIPAAPCTRGSMTAAASLGWCSSTAAMALGNQSGSSYPGVRTTGNRRGSNRSVPKPPSPTDSDPTESSVVGLTESQVGGAVR